MPMFEARSRLQSSERVGVTKCRIRGSRYAGSRIPAHSSEAGAGRRSRHGAHYRCSHERHRIRNYYPACLPESAKGGPLRPIRTGDEIRLSVRERRIDAMVSEQDLENRRREVRPVRGAARGYAKLYADSVLGPEFGCDFDFLRKDSVRIER